MLESSSFRFQIGLRVVISSFELGVAQPASDDSEIHASRNEMDRGRELARYFRENAIQRDLGIVWVTMLARFDQSCSLPKRRGINENNVLLFGSWVEEIAWHRAVNPRRARAAVCR